MKTEVQLDFFRKLLKGLHISSCLVENAERHIPTEIDLGLRAGLFGTEDYLGLLRNSFAEAAPQTVYRFYDEYACHYIFLQLGGGSYFFIGPYLTEFPTRQWLLRKSDSIGLAEPQLRFLEQYYSALPLMEDENILLAMTNTLASELWEGRCYSLEYVQYAIPDKYRPMPTVFAGRQEKELPLQLENIERNYANEKLLMEAVSKGRLHQLTAVAASVVNNGSDAMRPDSLRARKNDLIILKTLLRKAAEYGGVHPLHIHRLSSRYAGEIENIRSIKQSLRLQEEMIRGYCLLVKQQSLSRYSYYVGQVITLVQYDLTADLRLKAVAEKLNVNASYLSELFHREYGCTLTEFVNRERVEHSLHLLRTSSRPVQQIAADCGFQNAAYFIKVFKKHTEMTPNQYREGL